MTEGEIQPDSDSAEELFLRFAGQVLRALRDRASSGSLPRTPRLAVDFNDQLGGVPRCEDTFNYGLTQAFLPREDRIRETLDRCARRHLAERILPAPRWDLQSQPLTSPTFEEMRPMLARELVRPVIAAIGRNGFNPTRGQLLESYKRYKRVWTSPEVQWTATVPLVNLRSEIKRSVGLSPRFDLAPFPASEKTEFWNGISSPYGENLMPWQELARVRFKLIGSYTRGWDEPIFIPEVYQDTGAFLTALRLLRSGDVGARLMCEKTYAPYAPLSVFNHIFDDYNARPRGDEYTLDKKLSEKVTSRPIS